MWVMSRTGFNGTVSDERLRLLHGALIWFLLRELFKRLSDEEHDQFTMSMTLHRKVM